jgi:hypothetical protein
VYFPKAYLGPDRCIGIVECRRKKYFLLNTIIVTRKQKSFQVVNIASEISPQKGEIFFSVPFPYPA